MLSNLPPGVSVNMIPGNRPEDDWADMIAEGWRPHCAKCGGYLKLTEDRSILHNKTIHCSGIPRKYTYSYDDGTHEQILAIIGEEHRHETYDIYYCECGEETGPKGHDPHGLHEYEGSELIRICKRCGHSNNEYVY